VRVNYRAAPRAIWARMTFGTRNSSLSFFRSLAHSLTHSRTAGARAYKRLGFAHRAESEGIYVTVVYYNCVICIQTHSRNLSQAADALSGMLIILTIFLFLERERASLKRVLYIYKRFLTVFQAIKQ